MNISQKEDGIVIKLLKGRDPGNKEGWEEKTAGLNPVRKTALTVRGLLGRCYKEDNSNRERLFG